MEYMYTNLQRNFPDTLSGRTSSALAWHSEGRTFAAQ